MPPETIEIDQRLGLEPLLIPINEGFILTPARRVMIGAGLGISATAAGLMMTDGATAYAHDQPTDTVSTPHSVVIEEGRTVFDKLSELGLNPREIENDLARKGISPEAAKTLKVLAGSSWSIHPETIAEFESRVKGSVTISIETGGATFWQQLDDIGLGDTDTVKAILKDNGRDLKWATRAKDGASIVVDKKYLPDASGTPVLSSNEPETVELTLQGDSIIDDLRRREVENPTAVGIEAVALSGMTQRDSRRMQKGDEYSVRRSALPESEVNAITSEPKAVELTLQSGSIIEDLENLGVSNPYSVGVAALELSGMTPEDATRMVRGAKYKVPEDALQSNIINSADSEPTAVTLAQQGDSLTEILVEMGSSNPTADAQATLDSMGITRDDAEKHPVGFEYLVPASVKMNLQSSDTYPTSEQLQIFSENPKVKIFGDSLTEGMNVLGDLVQRGSESGLEIDSGDAVVGRSLVDVLSGPINMDEILGFDAVVMAHGTNPGEDDQVYINKLSDFFAQIRSEATKRGTDVPELFVVTLYEAVGSNVVRDETRNPLLAKLATEQGINLIDWASYASSHPETYADGSYHPTDYNSMAELFVSEITQKVTPTAESPVNITESESVNSPVEVMVSTETDPSLIAYNIIVERIKANGGVLDKEASQEVWHWLKNTKTHPEKSEDFPNPEMFIKTPAPSADFPYVVHPRTCTTELFAKPAGVFSAMLNVATLEYLLTDPQWAKYRNMVIELGDLASGDHKTHQHGDKADIRSRILTSAGAEIPDGAILNVLSPNYDAEFTVQFLVLLGKAVDPNGNKLFKHIEFQDEYVVSEVNSRLGREIMKYVKGHKEHIHLNADIEGETEDGVQGTPNTTSKCTYDFVNADPALIQAVIDRRATYPVYTSAIENSNESLEQELPTKEELIAAAWEMSADEYIKVFNNGEKYTVQLQNGSEAIEVPAEVQRAVDIVWRLENGVSTETVKNALKVGLAESGLNNSAINSKTGDRCLFQINKINRQFIEALNSKNGWNIDYDNLQNDIVGCARVAVALYKSDLDFKYSKEYIDEYVDRFGLNLPTAMYEKLTKENPVSLGFRAWLMSAKNHGLY